MKSPYKSRKLNIDKSKTDLTDSNHPTKPKLSSRGRYWLTNLGLFLFFYMAIHVYQTWSLATETSPNLSGTLLDGTTFELANTQYPVLVHFWATWCKVCSLEQSSIDAISQDYTTVAIASQSGTVKQVKAAVQQRGINAPVLVDNNGVWAKQFGIQGYPTSFIIDKDKQIRFVEVGYTTELGLRARLWLSD